MPQSLEDVRGKLIKQGMTEADAQMVIDITDHAANKAIDGITSTIDTLPEHLRGITFRLTLRMLESLLGYALDDIAPNREGRTRAEAQA